MGGAELKEVCWVQMSPSHWWVVFNSTCSVLWIPNRLVKCKQLLFIRLIIDWCCNASIIAGWWIVNGASHFALSVRDFPVWSPTTRAHESSLFTANKRLWRTFLLHSRLVFCFHVNITKWVSFTSTNRLDTSYKTLTSLNEEEETGSAREQRDDRFIEWCTAM